MRTKDKRGTPAGRCLFRELLVALAFLAAAQAHGASETLFVGSSTIEFWKTLREDFRARNPVNLGKGGTQYPYLIENAARWTKRYPGAKAVVIYSGDNDIAAGVVPARIADDFAKAAELFHRYLPRAHIYVISVKPSPRCSWKTACT